MTIENLNSAEYDGFFENYLKVLPKNIGLLRLLEQGKQETTTYFKSIPTDKLMFSYAEAKWTPKEILLHLVDTERILAYRALRIARRDRTELEGFNENDFATASNANMIAIHDLLEEYLHVRNATISLFKNFSHETLKLTGIANAKEISVGAIGFILAGHELHHLKIIEERYLKS
ncbi:MAG TPA: DinB family protein [Salinimicrobium sp.]|nr:DinB family protein [Salinimicrobium sp.]